MFGCGKVSKDFIKFRKFIRSNNLSIKEQYLLEYLFEFHNVKYGYSFPKFEDMLAAFNTTCRNTISNIIKHLEELNLLKVNRSFKNNRYYIIGVEEFLNGLPKKKVNVDSNGEKPLEGQISVEEFITEDEKKVMDHTKFGMKQVRKLLLAAKNKVNKVIDAFEYAKEMNPNNKFAYTLWSIKNGKKKEDHKKLRFNNFESREYDYKDLEWKLLGWNKNR